MKLYKNYFYVISIVFGLLLILGVAKPVDAQPISSRGYSCLPNYGDCQTNFGSNYRNLKKDLLDGTIKFESSYRSSDNLSKIIGYLDTAYGVPQSNFLCYQTGSITAVTFGATQCTAYGNNDANTLGHESDNEAAGNCDTFYPMMCAGDTVFSRSKENYTPPGCCRPGYDLVSQGRYELNQQPGSLSTAGFLCCYNQGGNGTPKTYDTGKGAVASACLNADGAAVWTSDTTPDGHQSVYSPGSPISWTAGGQFLGPVGSNPYIRQISVVQGADMTCGPTGSGCAVLDPGSPILTGFDLKTSGGNDYQVIDYSKLNDVVGESLQCNRCYYNGETMLVTDGSTDASGAVTEKAKIIICDTSKAKFYREEEVIGGSADVTAGYLLEDATNQAIYKQCFDTGGIYTAIGCIDPTPTGIITGIIRIALGVMGGVALLQLIYVGILYQQGNTEKIKGARSQLIATLTGVAVLVFSVLILRVIGVNILDTVANGSV